MKPLTAGSRCQKHPVGLRIVQYPTCFVWTDIGAIDVKITGNPAWEEAAWASFVNEAEEAISREHVSWRASRAV